MLNIAQMGQYRMRYLQNRDARDKEKMIKYTVLAGFGIACLFMIGIAGLVDSQRLRYMVDHTSKEAHTVMTIPERQMQNFMLVASHSDDSVMFLDEKTLKGKEGKHVVVTDGVFKGVTGVIRRVKHCKRVVVEIEGVASVAIAFVPSVLLKEID